MAITMRTMAVEYINSLRVDHVTLPNSVLTSSKNLNVFFIIVFMILDVASKIGRPGGIRTPNHWFWRPLLCQLELQAYLDFPN